MKPPKYVTESYTKHGLIVDPIPETERTEWYAFPGRPTLTRTDEKQRQRPRTCARLRHEGRASYWCSEHAVAVIRSSPDGHADVVCANHLSGAIRAAANDARRRAEADLRKRTEQQTQQRLAAIASTLGISVSQQYNWSSGSYSTVECVVNIDQLEALADRIGREEATR